MAKRKQTGELQIPGLSSSRGIVDSYVRPEQPQGGDDLIQLGASLSALNPGLASVMGRMYDKERQEKALHDSSQAAYDRGTISDPAEAKRILDTQAGTWSPEYLHRYEAVDAQIHANMYPGALRRKLEDDGLWNDEKADPAKIQAAISEVRSDFLQRGVGTSPAWTETFDQYRDGFERGVTQQWVEHIGSVRKANMERMAVDDLTSQLISHDQLPTVDELVTQWDGYAEATFTNRTMLPGEVNKAKTQAFLNAHSYALSTGNTALATRLMAAYQKVPTGGGLLSKTAYGTQALADMHQAVYFHNQQMKSEESEKKADLRESVLLRLFEQKELYRGKSLTEVPMTMPDDGLRRAMASIGMDADEEWASYRAARLAANNPELQQTARSAMDSVTQLRTQLRTVETKGQLRAVMDQIHAMDKNPDFAGHTQREELNQLLGEALNAQKRFGEEGKLGSRAYRMTESEIKSLGREMSSQALGIINDTKDKLEGGMLNRLMSQFNLSAELDPDTNTLTYGFTDLNQEMMDDFLKESDAVAEGLGMPWDKVPREKLRSVSSALREKYRPLFEKRVEEITAALKEQQKAKEESSAAADKAGVATSSVDGTEFDVSGASGAPTHDAVLNVLSSASALQSVKAVWRRGQASTPTGDPLLFAETQGDILVEMRVKNPSFYSAIFVGEEERGQMGHKLIAQAWNTKDPNSVYSRLFDMLDGAEKNSELMAAIKQTAIEKKTASYSPTDQARYADARVAFSKLASEIGFSTEETLSASPRFKPEWIDDDTPLFNFTADLTDENLKHAMKLMGRDSGDPNSIHLFRAVQKRLIEIRAFKHGLPNFTQLKTTESNKEIERP